MLLWAFAVGAGLEWMWTYSSTPGAPSHAPALWPAEAGPAAPGNLPALVMFVHPHCPCTRASLAELREIMERNPGRLRAQILFVSPGSAGDGWARTRLWKAARSIPGVTVAEDVDGIQARRFGATTSGHVALYDADHQLIFDGGITASRGHVGENAGMRQVMNLLAGRPGGVTTPVYGCSLDNRRTDR